MFIFRKRADKLLWARYNFIGNYFYVYIHFIFSKNEVIKISNDDNYKNVYKLIEFLKNNKLNANQKQAIYNIITSLENNTEKQKTRFIMYYSLKPSQTEKYTLASIGRCFGCSASAIKFSIISVRRALISLKDERSLVLKKILDELEK